MTVTISAREVAQRLGEQAEQLARELMPGGRREGNEFVGASIEGQSARALSIKIRGGKAGVWADFSGTARGDGLDFVAHALYGGDKKAAFKWALRWLGIESGGPEPQRIAPRPRPAPPAGPDADERASRDLAFRLFLSAEPHLAGTPAAEYLANRNLDLTQLGRQPRALRFHPACYCTEADARLPAMLGGICSADGQHVATHRTWLARDAAGVWRKAPLRRPKKVIGRYAGGTVRLWRGASGKPLREAPAGDVLVIAEGIENALAVAIACPEYRVVAGVSISNLAAVVLPDSIRDLIIASDNDAGNAAAEAALIRAADRWMAEDRNVRIARSSVGKDFNDALISE